MEPLFDATSLVSDPKALRSTLRQRGYLFIRNVLPRAILNATLDAILNEVKAGSWLKPGTDVRERRADLSAACVEPEAAFRAVYDKVFALESFHRLPHSETLIQLMQSVLGQRDILIHPRKIGRLIFPVHHSEFNFSTPAHQDYWALQGSPDTLTVWIPLHDCPVEHGSLMVAEGTHREGIFSYRLALGAGAAEVEDSLNGHWRGGDFEAGDVLIFFTLLVHKAAPNLTDRLRVSMDCRFQRPQEPVSIGCIQLVGESYEWPEIYQGWKHDDLKYYWKALDLRTVPYDPKYFARRDQLAFSEGEKGNPAAISALQRLVKTHADPTARVRAATLLESFAARSV